jgi:cytoskeleton protein RodZ
MTDSMLPETPEFAVPEPGAVLTAGQMIRAARLHKGMHLAVLSVNLKVPIRQLEALESDQHDTSKGPVFVRALASSVCRQLQIDPVPVLAVLPQSVDRLPLPRQALSPLHADKRMGWDLFSVLRLIPRQIVVIAAVMLAMIAALLWMPSPWTWSLLQSEPQASAQAPAPAVEVAPTVTEAAAAELQQAQAQVNEAQPAATAVIAPAPVAMAVQPSAPVVATGGTATTVPTPAPAASTTSAANKATAVAGDAGGAVLGFEASNDSWIEIRDGKNQVLWKRVVRAGESVQVQYPLPMNVVIGKARAVSVTYKGKPFDLAPHTKVTAARFEVKE